MPRLDHFVRAELIISALHIIYKSTDFMLNKTLYSMAKHNGYLQGQPDACGFTFNNHTYIARNSVGLTPMHRAAPILDGSLRDEFRFYKNIADIVEVESSAVERYIRRAIMASESKVQLLSLLPEVLHPACNQIEDENFNFRKHSESVITDEDRDKHINMIKMRLTLSLLETAA